MIYLTKKDTNRTRFLLNERQIEKIEVELDTIVFLANGKKLIVDETPDEIIDKIVEFESKILIRQQNKKETGNR